MHIHNYNTEIDDYDHLLKIHIWKLQLHWINITIHFSKEHSPSLIAEPCCVNGYCNALLHKCKRQVESMAQPIGSIMIPFFHSNIKMNAVWICIATGCRWHQWLSPNCNVFLELCAGICWGLSINSLWLHRRQRTPPSLPCLLTQVFQYRFGLGWEFMAKASGWDGSLKLSDNSRSLTWLDMSSRMKA